MNDNLPGSAGAANSCKCPHHLMIPLLITLIGVVLLLKALNVLSAGLADIIWPILLILIGLQKMMAKTCKCCCAK